MNFYKRVSVIIAALSFVICMAAPAFAVEPDSDYMSCVALSEVSETTEPSEPSESEPSEPEEDNSAWYDGILDFVSDIFDAIVGLPEKISEALTPSAVSDILDIFDFSFVTDFFGSVYDGLTSLFGLSDLIEGEDNPFDWLTPPDSFIEEVSDV